MVDKSNIKNDIPYTRRVVEIEKYLLKAMRKFFSSFGAKAECERETGITTDSLTRILRRGAGELPKVDKIKKFFESRTADNE